jgi:hypothetical protein
MKRIVGFFAVSAVLLMSNCAYRAQQLNSLPLNIDRSIDNRNQTDKSFLVYPLIDLRGATYSFWYPTSFIPPINLFHIGRYVRYPESVGILKQYTGGKPIVTVGSLPTSFPHLLASMMREMRLTNNVTPIDQINTKTDITGFDYVIMGKLTKTEMKEHANVIPLGVLSYIGAPFVFVKYETEFELELYKSTDMDNPIFKKKYAYSDNGAIGLYYNMSKYYELFVESLEKTLPDAIKDIAQNVN